MSTPSLWSDSEDDEPVALINTTPLVDVMLVLLIIFLITIPVVNLSVPVALPQERHHVRQAQADTVVISVDAQGRLYWFDSPVADGPALARRLGEVAARTPQPEVHVRGDQEAEFAAVSRVLQACKQAGIGKLSFITEPPARP